ncbi:MAG: protein kinase domain-containing protein, partial [Bryobacteraceae bacterium]
RLNRTVAIKILPSHLAQRPQLRERFEREARAVSSMNHPHICNLHDIGVQDGIHYMVMEFLLGESLEARLERGGPLTVEQLLQYASEIADALDHAHRQGVIHRDLKPANIMLTRDGTKLLDFGLAKLPDETLANAAGFANVPTKTNNLTTPGTILGTVQYMSPEQLEGREADARSDIFSFGSVMYEAMTGRKAFEAANYATMVTAIMSTNPPSITTLQPATPPALNRVVKRCLAKNPEDRWQTARDLASELAWIADPAGESGSVISMTAPARRPVRWMLFAGLAVALAVALAVLYVRKPVVNTAPLQFVLPQAERTTYSGLAAAVGPIAVSPDGRRVAFVANSPDGRGVLTVRPLGSLADVALAGTEGATCPFWSPDGSEVAFFADGKLKKVPASGGAIQTLCDAGRSGGGTWNQDGVIVFARGPYDGLYRVPSAGGVPVPITTLDAGRGETAHRWPQFLPDGRHFLYVVQTTGQGRPGVEVAALNRAGPKRLVNIYSNAMLAGSEYVLFVRDRSLMAQPLDTSALELRGEPFLVADRVAYDPEFGVGDFSVSGNGVLAYRAGDRIPATQLVWVDRVGREVGAMGSPGQYRSPRISPDERRIAVERSDASLGTPGVWIHDLDRNMWARLTFEAANLSSPIWSPDGKRVVYASAAQGAAGRDLYNLFEKAASGAGTETLLLKTETSKFATDWSKDGRFIAYETRVSKTGWDIWILPLEGDRNPFPFVNTQADERLAQFSPDGKWIAYTSTDFGRVEVYTQSFSGVASPSPAGPGGKRQISAKGGFGPRWRADGKELFFIGGEGKLMAVSVESKG